jgi:hypothetical protein
MASKAAVSVAEPQSRKHQPPAAQLHPLTGSEKERSKSGVLLRTLVASLAPAPIDTRRLSFSNWSIDSWRTRPRSWPCTSWATTTARW